MVHLELLAVVGTDSRIIFKLKRGIFEINSFKIKKFRKEELIIRFLLIVLPTQTDLLDHFIFCGKRNVFGFVLRIEKKKKMF
jgi:hypothetical protein